MSRKISVEVEVVTTVVKRVSIPEDLLKDREGDERNSKLERITDYVGEEVIRADWTPSYEDDSEE